MAAPKASEVGAELERIDDAIEVLKAQRKPIAETAEAMLERGIRICGPTKEFYLVPSSTFEIAMALLADSRVAKNIRDALVKLDGVKARKFFDEGMIPAAAWKDHAVEKPSVAMRSKKLKPATPERKKQVLEAAA